jgi:uncharacterized protein YjbJ (UPF0337 family)
MTDTPARNDSGAREQAQEKVQEVGGQAQEKAQQAAGEAKNRVRDQVDQRSTQAGQRVQTTAGDIRGVGEELRKQGKDQPAKLADQVADRAERAGGYLERSNGDTILRDVEDFGRRQPWAVALGGVALGIVASRLLKASSEGRYEQSRRSVSGDPGGGAWSSERDLPQTASTPQTVGV